MDSPNAFRSRLLRGSPVLGIWNTLDNPTVTRIFSLSGLHFQIVDFEHGPFNSTNLSNHVNSCKSANSHSLLLVRIPSIDTSIIQQCVDAGVDGLVFPHVETPEELHSISCHLSYPPTGTLGFSPYTPLFNYRSDTVIHPACTRDRLLKVIIIESLQGIENLSKILDSQVADIVYFGAYDLSIELGCPGDVFSPELVNIVSKSVSLVRSYGAYAGGFVPKTSQHIRTVSDLGIQFITYHVDSALLYESATQVLSHLSD